MYADLEEAEARRSVKERINVHSSPFRTPTRKRQRQEKWEHDLFDELHLSNRKVASRDLRFKLQKKGLRPALERGQPFSKVRDIFVKLSGIAKKRPATTGVTKVQKAPEPPNATLEESALPEASVSETKFVVNPAPKKKHQKDNTESFLESLGLEKYWITFQAEEVDMTVLKHMTDEDLKSMGIPMGLRKKILLALQSKLHM